METFFKRLRKWVMEIVRYEMKKMIQLTNDENDYQEKQNKYFICNKRFCFDNVIKDFKNYRKVRDHCRYTGKYRVQYL